MIFVWTGFILLIFALLALDLGVLNRKSHVISVQEALSWTAFWVTLALFFNVGIYFMYERHWMGLGLDIGHELTGRQAALQFFTGYLIEKSLSLDNIFVIALIFAYFKVPLQYQHRTLFWGIIGALVLRGAMIGAGTALMQRLEWMVYVFGGALICTAVKMMIDRHDNLEPDKNPLVRFARKFYPVTREFEGQKFFTKMDGRRAVTPLFLVLLVVESSDVLFAVDSIPAIFAVTLDPFLIFTSNVFAILGLRSLYFALAAVMDKFRYLKMSLVFLMAFVGVKMMISNHYHIPTGASLAVIAGILSVGISASIIGTHRDTAKLVSPIANEMENITRITIRQAQRVIVAIIGSTVLLIGIAMIVLPGPAIIVIPVGLTVLGTQFLWARRLLARMKCEAGKAKNKMARRLGNNK